MEKRGRGGRIPLNGLLGGTRLPSRERREGPVCSDHSVAAPRILIGGRKELRPGWNQSKTGSEGKK